MKKTIERLKNYFGLKKKIEPDPECFIKVSRFECFCESPCNEYCHGYTKQQIDKMFSDSFKNSCKMLDIPIRNADLKIVSLGEITTITSTPKNKA